jgi:hypothetical protein
MAEAAARARRPSREPRDVEPRPIVFAAAGLAAILAMVALVALGAHALLRPNRAGTPSPSTAEVSAPRLQSAPASDLAVLRRQKSAMLDEYRWIDPDRGVVRIPIDRAMQLTVERNAAQSAAEVAR